MPFTFLSRLSNSMDREDFQTFQDYNIRLIYSMLRRGGGQEATMTLLIYGGVGEEGGGGT